MGVDRYSGLPFVARFRWSVGKLMERFYRSFEEKKIMAAKCEKCSYTVVPPRQICPQCYSKLGESCLVELSGRGVVESFTEVNFKLDGKGGYIWLEKPEVLAAIKLDGASSTIFARVEGDVKLGSKVEPVWAEKTEGKPSDLIGFRVIE
ncbi:MULTISPECIES: Zn-ribbon domain-containing OB-fold protein [Archaeoglobus]|jgi:hypothetical protein|uniref:Zn-ribbon domain-containing OB-fold protein n=3 Tax=Archaeoglobus fulgidus TaxID=2234 RepID=O30102_ARCFU|nr:MULTISPECIES: Zn-ribbon domain-containing OB-fold protein [Archaeoglobus]AAB91102.1 conserved hypothetical protein [Archaeoglobus fulgidus DSM 4304]AIG96970.1 putative nucleic-acid-binding protein [Archaeoglobus fulgidus DSM 8774]KUJ94677.1 MAG: hypothetical protein XD40_0241 [Archaeoglobus fulgidus]KUK05611.1 MAG: hypothetical protein XD48_2151 [Archaeoglobus fulgidus]MDI3498720.1 uncharacterized protein [Archaeoglobus sp.]